MSSSPPLAVGVDIGSYYSRIAIWEHDDDNSISFVPFASVLQSQGSRTSDGTETVGNPQPSALRSVVAFETSPASSEGSLRTFVGESPIRWFLPDPSTDDEEEPENPSSVVVIGDGSRIDAPCSVLLLGRDYTSPATQSLLEFLRPFGVEVLSLSEAEAQSQDLTSVAAERANCCGVLVSHPKPRFFSSEAVVSLIGRALIDCLLEFDENRGNFRTPALTKAVLTVPADANDAQRQAMKDCAQSAGFNVLRIVNRPTAACIAYGLDRSNDYLEERHVVVIDVGALSTRVNVLLIEEGIYEVRATVSSLNLREEPLFCGGVHFTNALVAYFHEEIETRFPGWSLGADSKTMARLERECERVKRRLSEQMRCVIEIPEFVPEEEGGEGGNSTFRSQISRRKFEAICKVHFSAIPLLIQQALRETGLTFQAVHDVVHVGGSCYIPKVRSIIADFFHGRDIIRSSIPPDEVVAMGAATQVGVFTGQRHYELAGLLDVTCLSVGFAVIDDPDSLEESDATVSVLVRRNSTIPCRRTTSIVVDDSGDAEIVIGVFEGERTHVKDCRLIHTLVIPLDRSLPVDECFGPLTDPSRPLLPRLRVTATLNIDANGILCISVEVELDSPTNPNQHVAIVSDVMITIPSLSAEEIEALVRQAEQFREEDVQLQTAAARDSLRAFARGLLISYAWKGDPDDQTNDAWKLRRGMVLALANESLEWLDKFPEETLETYRLKREILEQTIRGLLADRSIEIAERSRTFPPRGSGEGPSFDDLDVD